MVFTLADLIALLPMLEGAVGQVATLISTLQNENRSQPTPEEMQAVADALAKIGVDRARFDATPNPNS